MIVLVLLKEYFWLGNLLVLMSYITLVLFFDLIYENQLIYVFVITSDLFWFNSNFSGTNLFDLIAVGSILGLYIITLRLNCILLCYIFPSKNSLKFSWRRQRYRDFSFLILKISFGNFFFLQLLFFQTLISFIL